jgi:hypothetical protein
MKPAFLILPLAVALSACAQTIMTADADCKPVAAVHLGGSAALLNAGISPMFQSIARDERGANKLTQAAVTTECARKNPTPRTYDMHRLGDGPALPGMLIGASDTGASCPKAHRA